MKKKLIVISCMLVLVLCVSATFAACSSAKMDQDTLQMVLDMITHDFNNKTVTEADVLPGEFETTDAKGNEATVYFTWKVTDTLNVSVKEADDGTYSLKLPSVRTEAITFTVKVTIVDAKGNAYLDSNKQPISANVTLKAAATTGGGGQQGGGDNQGDGDNQGGGQQGGGGGTQETVTFVMESQGFTDKAAIDKTISKDGITIAFSVGTGKTQPSYYTNNGGNAVRLYGGNTMTISGKTIVKVVLTFATEYDSNEITVNSGTFTSPTWTGSTTSLVFTIGGTSGNRRITQIAVTYEA